MKRPPGRPPSDDRRREPCDRNALHGALPRTGGHARGCPAAAGSSLAGGLGLAVLGAALFALVAHGVLDGATQAFDQAAVEWMRARTTRWLDWLAIAGAVLGSGAATWVVLLAGSAVLWPTRHRLHLLLLWIVLPGGRVLGAWLKALFDRPRPAPTGWELEVFGYPVGFPASPAFPSGHAINAVTVFGTLAYLAIRLAPDARARRLVLAAAAGSILLIGLSRVYLGVHYPSDVLAGYLAGFAWAALAATGVEAARCLDARRTAAREARRRLERPAG